MLSSVSCSPFSPFFRYNPSQAGKAAFPHGRICNCSTFRPRGTRRNTSTRHNTSCYPCTPHYRPISLSRVSRRFPVTVSPFSGSLSVGFLAFQTAIDFLLDLALREFLSALGADFGNALRGLHVLCIGLNRRMVSVHCHVLSVARPGLLGGYGSQGEIVRFFAHDSLRSQILTTRS